MYSFYLWHLDSPEERNFLEAEYISFLIRLSDKKLGTIHRKMLDLACGVGRHHRYLRENGLEVYGIDSNEELIRLAKERNRGYEDFYKIEDMRKITYMEEFDIVLNWFTSFGYFSDEENRLVLRNIYRALRHDGILILDMPVKWREGDSIIIHDDNVIEIIQRRRMDDYRFDYRAKLYMVEEEKMIPITELRLNITIYPPEMMKKMLEEAGFKILYVFANMSIVSVRDFVLADLVERGVRRLVWVVYK